MDPRAVRIRDNATVDMVQALRRLSPKVGTTVQPAIAANAMAASICSALIDVPAAARDEVLLDLFAWFDKGSFHRESAPRRALRAVGDGLSDFLNHDDRYEGVIYVPGDRVRFNQRGSDDHIEGTVERGDRDGSGFLLVSWDDDTTTEVDVELVVLVSSPGAI